MTTGSANGMPQRPRSHELDAEARRRFEGFLPSSWVVRQISEEYGIDLEVEVFEGGAATGLLFKVQLKGTDQSPNRRGASVQIKTRSLSYWLALDLPVLVVRYMARTGAVYVRWAHSHDSHPRRESRPPKNTTFKFNPSHRADAQLFRRLLTDLHVLRALRNREVNGALPVRVVLPESLHSRSAVETRAMYRRLFAQSDNALRFADDSEEVVAELQLSRSKIRFVMPVEKASLTIHHGPNDYSEDGGLDRLLADSVVAVATVLSAMGLNRQAVALVEQIGAESTLPLAGDIAGRLAYAYMEQGRVRDSLKIVAPLLISPAYEDRRVGDEFLAPIIHCELHRLDDVAVSILVEALRRRIPLELQDQGPGTAGRVGYLLGQIFRARAHWREQVEAYDEAARLDPSYRNRPYFFRERGGALFEAGRYSEAVEDYRHVIDLGGASDVHFVLADALLHAGRYAEALAELKSSEKDSVEFHDGNDLLAIVVGHVVGVTGLDVQQRRPLSDDELVAREAGLTTHEEVRDLLRQTDALDPRIWVRVAVLNETEEEAFRSITVAARVCLYDPALWIMAVASGLEASQPRKVVNSCADAAYRFCSDNLLEVLDYMAAKLPDDDASVLRRLIHERIDRPPYRPPHVLRLVYADGEYEEINLRPESASSG